MLPSNLSWRYGAGYFAAALAFLSAIAFPSIGAAEASEGPSAVAQSAGARPPMGKELYGRACARCHGLDGKGDRPDIQLNAPMPNFARCAESAEEPDAQWRLTIEKGGMVYGLSEQMPAYGESLNRAQIDSLLEYMRSFCSDRRWVRGELNFPRPLFTEKAYPENELVFSPSIRRSKGGGPTLVWNNILERRVAPRTQVEVILPFRGTEAPDLSGRSSRNSGVGDLEVGIKQVLVDSLPHRFILSAGTDLSLPSGRSTQGLGAGTAKFEPFISAGKELRGWILQTNFKIELPVDSEKSEREIAYSVAIGYPMYRSGGVRDLLPVIEIVGSRELKKGEPTSIFLVPQFRVPIDRLGRWAFAFGPVIPVTRRSSARAGLAAYLLHEYGGR